MEPATLPTRAKKKKKKKKKKKGGGGNDARAPVTFSKVLPPPPPPSPPSPPAAATPQNTPLISSAPLNLDDALHDPDLSAPVQLALKEWSEHLPAVLESYFVIKKRSQHPKSSFPSHTHTPSASKLSPVKQVRNTKVLCRLEKFVPMRGCTWLYSEQTEWPVVKQFLI